MEESEYKSAYSEIADIRCAFEKALTNNKARCCYSRHFWLADREGYACKSEHASSRCRCLLKILRRNARFALKLPQASDQLPHNMEIRVQAGGLAGMKRLLGDEPANANDQISDIHQLVEHLEAGFGGVENIPYDRIIPFISAYQGRIGRRRK